MNGETYQLARIVLFAGYAARTSQELLVPQTEYEKSIEFRFLNKQTFFGQKPVIEKNTRRWFSRLMKTGAVSIRLGKIKNGEKKEHLGFANTTAFRIVTAYKDGRVTQWKPEWEYSQELGGWKTTYYEKLDFGTYTGVERTDLEYVYRYFGRVLLLMEALADKIGEEGFARIFRESYATLKGTLPIQNTGLLLPPMSEQSLRVFMACDRADVFGAMGSWNDTPPYSAQEHGLKREYNKYSQALLDAMHTALLSLVNVS